MSTKKKLLEEMEGSEDAPMATSDEEEEKKEKKQKKDEKMTKNKEKDAMKNIDENTQDEAIDNELKPQSSNKPDPDREKQDQTSQGSMKLIEQLLLENSELRKTNEDNISDIGKLNELVNSITKDSKGADYANRRLCDKMEDQEAKISALKEENKALTKRVIDLENDVRLLNAKLNSYESTQKAEVAANLEAKVLADIEARFEAKLKTQQKDLESKMEALTKKVGSLDLKEDK
jgi:hypothetical protein